MYLDLGRAKISPIDQKESHMPEWLPWLPQTAPLVLSVWVGKYQPYLVRPFQCPNTLQFDHYNIQTYTIK